MSDAVKKPELVKAEGDMDETKKQFEEITDAPLPEKELNKVVGGVVRQPGGEPLKY
jgi:hypothetical protein